MCEKKAAYLNSEVKHRTIDKNYDEFAVKNAYPLVRNCRELRKRLPHTEMNLKRYPDRKWFWGICYTVIP